jgi:hypothetical protein
LLGIIFDPEGKVDVSLQNIGLSRNYIALPRPDISPIHEVLPRVDVSLQKIGLSPNYRALPQPDISPIHKVLPLLNVRECKTYRNVLTGSR